MPVTKEITRLEKSNVRMTLTIPKEEVASGYRNLLAEYTKEAQIPGFRKGKVPPQVLERKFGEALKGEALGKILEKAVEEAFEGDSLPADERPLPYSRPEMEGETPTLDVENDMVISFVYDVKPTVVVGQWKGLEVEVPESAVSDEDLARELEAVRERNSFVMDRDDDAEAQTGDIVTISYCELDESGEPLPDTGRDDFVYTLGSGQSDYMYDDEIAGMKKGETKEFVKTYPEAAEGDPPGRGSLLAGQTVRMRLTLTTVKEKKLPDLDDELAQDVDEKFQTLDDLRKSIRDRMEASLDARLRELRISGLIEKIRETTPITLPESMVRVEIGGRISALGRNFGMSPEATMQMLASGGGGLDNVEAQWRPSAEKALYAGLIVDALIDDLKIETSDEDLKQELEKLASAAGESEDDVRERYSDEQLEYLKNDIAERKCFDMLLAENTLRAGSRVSYLDLMANNG